MFRSKTRKAAQKSCKPKMARSMAPRLDRQKVKRKPGAEQARRRAAGSLGKALLRLGGVAALTALVTAGLLAGYTALAGSSRYRVKKAEVVGTRNLSRWAVLKAAGVGSQDNLVSLSVGKIKHRVGGLPWVREVKVSREFPSTVRIEVTEREVHALALVDGRLMFLDRELKAFTPVFGTAIPDRPVITGLGMGDIKSPDPEILELFGLAGEVPGLLPAGERKKLSEIHLDRIWGLELVFNDMPAVVRLGRAGFGARIKRLARIKKDLAARGELERALVIDMLADDKTVVRLGGETA